MRVSPDNIKTLKSNQVFVFGSNTLGLHNGGAAHFAFYKFDAKWGLAEGLSGQTYAIPTCTGSIEKVPIDALKKSVDAFIQFAKENQHLEFLVTQIGTGIAGWSVGEVAPMFYESVNLSNVFLPEIFLKEIAN